MAEETGEETKPVRLAPDILKDVAHKSVGGHGSYRFGLSAHMMGPSMALSDQHEQRIAGQARFIGMTEAREMRGATRGGGQRRCRTNASSMYYSG